MPQRFKEIYNGNTIVLRKITKKPLTGGAVKPACVAPLEGIQTVAPPTKVLDAKAMRAKLTAELFKSL